MNIIAVQYNRSYAIFFSFYRVYDTTVTFVSPVEISIYGLQR